MHWVVLAESGTRFKNFLAYIMKTIYHFKYALSLVLGSESRQLIKRSFACKLSSTWKKQKAIRRK